MKRRYGRNPLAALFEAVIDWMNRQPTRQQRRAAMLATELAVIADRKKK